jgi:hypothetical protein
LFATAAWNWLYDPGRLTRGGRACDANIGLE